MSQVMGGCGVKESTPFVVRDTARRFFDVTLAWTSFVVEATRLEVRGLGV